ncbi:hypothetical protein QN416_24935, partial [Glaciimonas sp. Cout2]
MESVYILVGRRGNGEFLVEVLNAGGVTLGAARPVSADDFPGYVLQEEPGSPRWVWEDTASIYPVLLEAGVRVERA